ncbi:bactofilin family protein [Paenibacillus caui]|uniref:bactofilin family protein n=1 Tax=Paenibacillus caui TaxID=2873927 RepID=UPI001CA90FA7|nr:polymer-forming cytoskeletal protein [Paenibacillus caui]
MKNSSRAGKSTYTLVGQGSDMEGRLKSQSGVRIEGVFRGEIESAGEVVIGASGEAHSNIKGASIIVAGKVFGDLVTEGRVTLLENGHIVGNVDARTLVIAEGGVLNGETRMDQPLATVRDSRKKGAAPTGAEAG